MNKTVKWFKKYKKPVLLFSTVGMATMATSLVMWRLLGHNHQEETAKIETNFNSESSLGHNWIYNEPIKNLSSFEQYKDKYPYIEFDKPINEMNILSILFLNGIFLNINERIPAFDVGASPYLINFKKAIQDNLKLAQQIANEYIRIHKNTYNIIITAEENGIFHITQEFADYTNLAPLHWKWTPKIDPSRISEIYNL